MTSHQVRFHPAAADERAALEPRERVAVDHAIEKLRAVGDALGYPHTSLVKSAKNLRELRPRAGRSATRAFYRRVGGGFVIAAVGPEANVNPRGFKRAVGAAELRLAQLDPK